MFNPALKMVVRLPLFLAALTASVAIGASTRAAEVHDAALPDASSHRQWVAMEPSRPIESSNTGIRVTDSILVARATTLDLLASPYPVESLDTALTTPEPVIAARANVRRKFELPRPDRWTSLLATLALGAFFFLRRIV